MGPIRCSAQRCGAAGSGTLARWLGHSSPAITLGYYAHFMPENGSKGRGTIDGRLGERGDRLAGRSSPDSHQRR
ncbi:integrase [Streptomyces sp. SID10853]|nr:integrase [Streptomyces sp. SID10853]